MSPAHGSARLLMASTAARGCLLHLAVPFHLLFWKACFGGDPGINSLCEANDFQKCMTGFFVGFFFPSPPCPFVSGRRLYICLCWLGEMLLENTN